MKSLGVIETIGLVAAVQAVDAACKAAGVACIGYRKVGSGLVSVCFEGEISAIHTAIERGVAVAGAQQQVKSLVIARPERSVVDALRTLKGHPPRAQSESVPVAPVNLPPLHVQDEVEIPTEVDAVAPVVAEHPVATPPASGHMEDKNIAPKKGKKHD